MTNEQRTSRAVIEQKLSQGAAIMDAGGETIGTVGTYDMEAGYMTIVGGALFPDGTRLPLTAIGDTGASGLYLTGSKDELVRQYSSGGAPPPPVPSAADEQLGRGRAALDTQDQESDIRDTAADDIHVPVRAEELVVGTREQEQGRVHLHKDVIEEQQTVNVPLTQEHVTVERVPVSEQADVSTADAFTEKNIDVPVMGEEAVVGKQVHMSEEVRLHKDTVTEQQQVSDTVRKERVIVEGADEVRGANDRTNLQG